MLSQGVFICWYNNISQYPFDEEKCSLKLQCIGEGCNLLNLNPRNLTIIPEYYGQYKVLGKETFERVTNDVLEVKIVLGRNILSIFMVTYLPTILMNIINQSTNYINLAMKCEFIITVNITCMMVLTSIYISIATSLPPTASIKPVEFWLLFNLAYPFLIIIVNILLQARIAVLL